jgi:hypothetical protein
VSCPTAKSPVTVQEFLKRIPSATALSSQNIDDKPNMFGSTSTNSLFGFATGANDASMHKVASLDMLRSLVEQRQEARNAEAQQGEGASPQPTQLFQASAHQASAQPAQPGMAPPHAGQGAQSPLRCRQLCIGAASLCNRRGCILDRPQHSVASCQLGGDFQVPLEPPRLTALHQRSGAQIPISSLRQCTRL